MAYVYEHIRKDTGEVFYVGIGSDKLFKRAFITVNRNYLWNEVVGKTEYEIKIREQDIEWESACKIEMHLIRKYGRLDLGTGTLTNLTEGGEGFKCPHKQSTKDKIRQTTEGKTYEERYGKKKAVELKKLRRERQKEVWSNRDPEVRQKIASKIGSTRSILPKEKIEELVKLWNTGEYTQKNLASLFKIKPAQVGSLVYQHKNKSK